MALDVESAGQTKDPWGNERAGFAGKTAVDRKDFGLTWNQVLEAGGVMVGDRSSSRSRSRRCGRKRPPRPEEGASPRLAKTAGIGKGERQ